ncbi:hypothetical protein C4Q26_16535 [Pseudomonas sp. SWI44]|nr:hypothetical protein C4Q26_16535 [Pseudomonas sp. SWI44]
MANKTMNMFSELLSALQKADGKKIRKEVAQLADRYEKLLFEIDGTSDESVDFMLSIFSDERLFNKPGMDIFVLKAGTEFFCMTDEQKSKIYNALLNAYHKCSNLDYCWATGDLIARNFNRKCALHFFSQTFVCATKNGKEGIALGLDVIARQEGRNQQVKEIIARILRSG